MGDSWLFYFIQLVDRKQTTFSGWPGGKAFGKKFHIYIQEVF